MNNGSGDAKEQNIAERPGIIGCCINADDDRFGKCPRNASVLPPPSLPPPSPLSSLEVINVANSRQLLSSSSAVSDRNRAVTFSCYTCTIIIVSRNHACRIVYGYIARLCKRPR